MDLLWHQEGELEERLEVFGGELSDWKDRLGTGNKLARNWRGKGGGMSRCWTWYRWRRDSGSLVIRGQCEILLGKFCGSL
jgi:hypothetical protein